MFRASAYSIRLALEIRTAFECAMAHLTCKEPCRPTASLGRLSGNVAEGPNLLRRL